MILLDELPIYIPRIDISRTFTLDRLTEWTRDIKEQRVIEYRDHPETARMDGPEMEPLLLFHRDDQLIAFVRANRVDKMEGLECFHLGWHGFLADRACMILDAHMQIFDIDDPAQMEAANNIKAGDMQRMCDDEDACERRVISDVMLLHYTERDQDEVHLKSLPYKYDTHEKRGMAWTTNNGQFPEELFQGDGFLINAVRQIKEARLPEFEMCFSERDVRVASMLVRAGHDVILFTEADK